MGERFTVISKAGEGNVNTAKEEKPRFTVISKANSSSEKSILPSPTEMFKKMILSPDPAVKQAVSAAQNGKSFASPNILAQNVYSINKQDVGNSDTSKKNLFQQAVGNNTQKYNISYDVIKGKLKRGEGLTSAERKIVTDFGVKEFIGGDTQLLFDINAQKNSEKTKKIIDKKNSGKKLTSAEEDILETAKLVNPAVMEINNDMVKLTDNPNTNRQNQNLLKAQTLYKNTAYTPDNVKMGEKEIKLPNNASSFEKKIIQSGNKLDLYLGSGIEQYASGIGTTIDLIAGKSNKEIADRTSGAYTIAGSVLSQHYTETGKDFDKAIQDIVTNIAQNAIPMAAGMGLGAVGVSSTAANIISQAGTFAPSIFGNAYKEGLDLGVTDTSKLLTYAFTTAAAETTLGIALNNMPGLKGVISENAAVNLTKNIINPIASWAIKTAIGGGGEFLEESIQEILSPLMQKYILGADVDTIISDPLGQLSNAAYAGFIGFASSVLMSGGMDAISAKTESNLKKYGQHYLDILGKNNIDIKNIATYITEITEKETTANKTAELVKNGDTSAYSVGVMVNELAQLSDNGMKTMYEAVGREITKNPQELQELISGYKSLVEDGYIFPEKVDALFEQVKGEFETKESVSDSLAGEFAINVQIYSPRALIIGQAVKNIDSTVRTNEITNLKDDENTSSVFAEDNIEQGADGELNELREQTGFTEPSDREIYQPPTKQEELDALFGKPKNAKQRHIEKVSDKFGIKIIWSDEVSRGKYVPSTKSIVLNPNIRTAEMYNFVFKHEFTHYLEGKQGYTDFKNYVFKKSALFEKWVRERLDKNGIDSTGSREKIIKRLTQIQYEAYKNSDEMSKVMRDRFTMNDAEEEVLADFVGERLLGTGGQLEKTLDMLSDINRQHRGIFQKIRDFVRDMINRFKGDKTFKGLVSDLEYLNERLKRVAESANKKISDNETEKYSFAGYAEDGKGMYKSNFPKGTPKIAKAQKILSYIQDVWSKKPIKLNITDSEGNIIKTIDAQFDPTYNNDTKIVTDASKLMGGNRHGSAAEQRVTLDLADDYYQIASESKYNYSKSEIGKNKPTHDGVKEWHYFVNDIYFAEYDSDVYEPYTVSINVKEKPEGDFVYSFSAEKQKENSTQQTLHAVVSGETPANAKLFKDIISEEDMSVNTSISENAENDTEKNSIAVLSADELLDKYDRGEITREEYLKQTDTMTRRAALQYVQEWERENGAILSSKNRLEAEREKAVELEREEQQMLKDRESNIWAIRRTVRKLDRALRTNTNSKHIPEAYKNVVRGVCKLFVDNDKATFEHKDLADIYSYYIEMKGNGDTIPDAPQYDPFIDELLQSLTKTLSGRKLTELNSLELGYVRAVINALNYTVDHEAQVFIDGKKEKYEEVGRAALNDIENANPNKLIGALQNELATELREYLYEGNMLPEYFFKRLGPTFEKIFNDLIDGMNKWARNMEISKDFWSNTKSKYDYNGWKNDTVSFKTELGNDITITIEQAMQLVATAQRERSNNIQKPNHLSIGGVVIDFKYIKKAIKSHIKRKISKSDLTTIWNNVNGKAIQISFNDVEVVSRMLSSNQKGYIKDVVDFLSTQCAAWGNEVTMGQYGYRQFNESNYFPYVSSKLFLETDPARNDNIIIRRASFTHSLQKNANNPLLLTSFTDVAAQHIESMCNFNAMTMPLETLNKVLNYQTEAIKGVKTGQSVKQAIENKFGTGAAECMQNLINDLNTGVRGDQRDRFSNKMISLYKKNAVLANLSVIIQQPFAIIRAIADINVKYFAKAYKYRSKNNYEECKQYAPVAIIKQMGRFDTGVGVNNTAWMTGEKTIRDKADDFFGWGAGKADEIAWSFLWSSVKAEIADTTDLKVGSDEFLTKAGERFTELVNKTQVYDSVLTKSQNMRNKGLVGSITSFMSEPTVALNMVVNSFLDFKEGKISGKKFSRIIMSVATAEIVTAMMQSIITAARDDDEDKSYFEKYLKNVVSNSLSNFNLAGKIPYIRDVISIWEGYDVERGDIKAVSDLIKAFQTVIDENKSWDEKVRRISEALAALYGVPLKNINRDIEAIVKTIYGFAFGAEKTDVAGLEFAIGEGLGIIKNTSDKYSALAKAGENGNEEKYDRMYDNLLEAGKDEGDIKSGIKNYYRTDKDVKKEGSKLFSDLEDNKTFKSLKKEDKSKLEKDIISSLATEKTVSAMVREPDVFDELYEALRNNKNLYNQKKKELMASGMSESLIDDGIEAARISYMKSIGIDVNEYLLYKIATSKKYADTNNSGGVSKSEKTAAINKMDLDENAKRFFNGSYK